MKINLIPISHPELNTIELENDVFLIGRLEENFVTLTAEVTMDLSRHHAKIMVKDGRVSIIDLKSLNGTTLNNQLLSSDPTQVNNGDIIEFANCLSYKLKIETPDPESTVLAAQKTALYLKLTPVNKSSDLDILVVTSFPFIISKEFGVFPSFSPEFASEVRHISRRHAQIIYQNNALKLVDMSSTNNTFINSQRIDNAIPVTLKEGDIIAFAGDFFVYTVKLMTQQEAIPNTTLLSAGIQGPKNVQRPINQVQLKTIFVNEPGPFLDILCGQVEDNNTAKELTTQNVVIKNSPSLISAFLQLCKASMGNNRPTKKTTRYYFILSCMVISLATAYFYYTDNIRNITRLIQSGHNRDAVEQAARSLIARPDDKELRSLFNLANLNQLIPDWLKKLKKGDYQRANQILLEAKNNTLESQSLISSIIMLQWVGDVHQFMFISQHQGGIEIFEDEKIINDLLTFWHKNKTENRKSLAELARITPAFQPYFEQVLSHIRSLEYSQNVYLKASSRFKVLLLQHLKSADSSQAMLQSVSQFEQKYPLITGLGRLKRDISHYADLNNALSNKDLATLVTLAKQYHYQTPLFVTAKQTLLLYQFPSHEFRKLYLTATQSWQAGHFESAIETLQKLQNSHWKILAQDKLVHYQRVLKAYKALQAAQGSAEYTKQLFRFDSFLQQPEDDYFLLLIQKDLKINQRLFLENAQQDFFQAQNFWNAYSENNGINGTMRLETEISNTFKNQAENLSSAFNHINSSLQYYENLDKNLPTEVFQLFIKIKKELEKQRLRLTDLEFIISAKLLSEKLSLLKNQGVINEQ